MKSAGISSLKRSDAEGEGDGVIYLSCDVDNKF